MTFRADIEGLRAIAVGVIVLYHAGLSTLSGGFVGVDVFFVISGFLITSLLVRDIDAGTFSFGGFYARRIRRLVPSLIATVAATMVAGWFILGLDTYVDAAKAGAASLLSVSNIFFWTQAGYFDAASLEKPFLHTWSLGVEEQFYLLWPMALVVLVPRISRKILGIVVAILILLSLAAAEWMLGRDPVGAFFLLPFRICELGLGALLAVIRTPQMSASRATALAGAGVVTILAVSLTYEEAMRFPGLAAMVPALACAAVILAGPSTPVNRALGNALFRYIGKISYSVYLAHWPIVVFYTYRLGAPATVLDIALLVAASLAAGAVLFHGIENPLRHRGTDGFTVPTRRLLTGTVAAGVGLITAGAVIVDRDGFPDRLPADLRELSEEIQAKRAQRREAIRRSNCHFSMGTSEAFAETFATCNPVTEGAIVVLGDSHAADVWAGMARAFPDAAVVQLTGVGCDLTREFPVHAPCRKFWSFALDWLAANEARIDMILYRQSSNRFLTEVRHHVFAPDPEAERRVAERLGALSQSGNQLVVLGPAPEFRPGVKIAVSRSRTLEDFDAIMGASDVAPFEALDARLKATAERSSWSYFSLYDLLCAEDCRFRTATGALLYVDYGHWSPDGAVDIAREVASNLPELGAHLGLEPN